MRIKWRSLGSTHVCGSFVVLVSSAYFVAQIPSLCGMLVYRETKSIVTINESVTVLDC